ncbi:MAG: DUF3015 family protein [bacterium]
MKKMIGIALALGLLAVPTAFADNGAGCGIGKQIWIGQKGLVPHALAWYTNNTSSLSSSITSGTSGCSVDGVIMIEKEAEIFVAQNLDNISQDMAAGDGRHLRSLAVLMGCSGAYTDFASMTQVRYPALFDNPEAGSAELLTGLRREIAANPQLAESFSVS